MDGCYVLGSCWPGVRNMLKKTSMHRVEIYYARNECGEISVEAAELPSAAVSHQY